MRWGGGLRKRGGWGRQRGSRDPSTHPGVAGRTRGGGTRTGTRRKRRSSPGGGGAQRQRRAGWGLRCQRTAPAPALSRPTSSRWVCGCVVGGAGGRAGARRGAGSAAVTPACRQWRGGYASGARARVVQGEAAAIARVATRLPSRRPMQVETIPRTTARASAAYGGCVAATRAPHPAAPHHQRPRNHHPPNHPPTSAVQPVCPLSCRRSAPGASGQPRSATPRAPRAAGWARMTRQQRRRGPMTAPPPPSAAPARAPTLSTLSCWKP